MIQNALDSQQAQAFLTQHLSVQPSAVALVGAGAWSQCFGFRVGEQDLVVRFGKYVDDFRKDQRAYTYATPDLPIPRVSEIGLAFNGYYAISTRAYGIPLEKLNATQWRATVPALAAALEAMRTADLSATHGMGGWGDDGNAAQHSWADHLLAVGVDTPDRRTHGWRKQLASHPQGKATFAWGFDLLKTVANIEVPRCLLHCDLVNRNVLVDQNKLSGVFDWGCSLYGDHLYELAWFEFWSPWYPDLDIRYLRLELERHWHELGYAPQNKAARLMACYLHIGLDHLAYNAYIEDGAALSATIERMRDLVAQR